MKSKAIIRIPITKADETLNSSTKNRNPTDRSRTPQGEKTVETLKRSDYRRAGEEAVLVVGG